MAPFKIGLVEVTRHRVSDLLCNALEGGSNYWYTIDKTKTVIPPVLNFRSDEKEMYWHLDYALNEGGAIFFTGKGSGKDVRKLDLESIEKGLKVMQEKFPLHWANFMEENDDAETGDVFLQCCLFGELVFG